MHIRYLLGFLIRKESHIYLLAVVFTLALAKPAATWTLASEATVVDWVRFHMIWVEFISNFVMRSLQRSDAFSIYSIFLHYLTRLYDGVCSSHASATATCEQSRPKQGEGKDQASDTYKWLPCTWKNFQTAGWKAQGGFCCFW